MKETDVPTREMIANVLKGKSPEDWEATIYFEFRDFSSDVLEKIASDLESYGYGQ